MPHSGCNSRWTKWTIKLIQWNSSSQTTLEIKEEWSYQWGRSFLRGLFYSNIWMQKFPRKVALKEWWFLASSFTQKMFHLETLKENNMRGKSIILQHGWDRVKVWILKGAKSHWKCIWTPILQLSEGNLNPRIWLKLEKSHPCRGNDIRW